MTSDEFTTSIPGPARQTHRGRGIDPERVRPVLKRYAGRWVYADMFLESMGLRYVGKRRLSGPQRAVITRLGYRVSESYRIFPGREGETLKVRVVKRD